MLEDNNAYEKRIVRYEHIHSIDPNDFQTLIDTINPQNNQNILDMCCGYWAVSKNILERIQITWTSLHLTLLDNSNLQISRAKDEMKKYQIEINDLNFVLWSAINTPFPSAHFDVVVNKMWLHEVVKNDQKLMVNEMYRILKENWKCVIWELALSDQTQLIFQKFIRKKDSLSEFDSLVANRYFPTQSDTLELLQNAWFKNVKLVHHVYPKLSVRNRKSEFVSAERIKMEKENAVDEEMLETLSEERINLLIDYVKNNLSDEEKNIMQYTEIIDKDWKLDIIMSAQKAIFEWVK